MGKKWSTFKGGDEMIEALGHKTFVGVCRWSVALPEMKRGITGSEKWTEIS